MKRIGVIIFARFDSTRLPGKALREVNGKPLLDYVRERAEMIEKNDDVVIATSDRAIDDPIALWAASRGIGCFRGSCDDVAGRALHCARHFGFEAFIRINGDSPLIDFNLLSHACRIFQANSYEIVTNVLHRSYPPGNSVEIIQTAAMARAYDCMTQPAHHEHVTSYFYEHAADFAIFNLESGNAELVGMHLAVDTPEDLQRFAWLVGRMDGGHVRYSGEIVYGWCREYERLGKRAGVTEKR